MRNKSVIHRCTFEGCPKSVEYPETFVRPPPGWAWLADWGPGVKDGIYCEPHANALEEMLLNGELATIQAGDDPDDEE
jgi:hypothetical protein